LITIFGNYCLRQSLAIGVGFGGVVVAGDADGVCGVDAEAVGNAYR
jgi:hypothetical protein